LTPFRVACIARLPLCQSLCQPLALAQWHTWKFMLDLFIPTVSIFAGASTEGAARNCPNRPIFLTLGEFAA
jgi:hypothetical protein